MKKTYKINGMHCASCAAMIELDLEDAGVSAKCSYANQNLVVEKDQVNIEKIKEVVEKAGYELVI